MPKDIDYFCDSKTWKEQLIKHRTRLENADGSMLECLEDEWSEINWSGEADKRGGLLNVSDNPFSTLDYYMDRATFPPPELLLVITDMYNKYISAAGDLSLEDVFFGPKKKGIGNYAARESQSKNSQYSAFHSFRRTGKHKHLPEMDHLIILMDQAKKQQEDAHLFLVKLRKANRAEQKKMRLEHYSKPGSLNLSEYEFLNIPDEDSFLRGYRRWKQQMLK